jgi:hypothetical protein
VVGLVSTRFVVGMTEDEVVLLLTVATLLAIIVLTADSNVVGNQEGISVKR